MLAGALAVDQGGYQSIQKQGKWGKIQIKKENSIRSNQAQTTDNHTQKLEKMFTSAEEHEDYQISEVCK